jgi:hypothetical protein
MPPEDPTVCSHLLPEPQGVYFRLLRPELVQVFKSKFPQELLHPDSLTQFISQATEQEQNRYNGCANKASRLLLEQIQTFAAELNKLKSEAVALLFQSWSSELHKRGINLRHQGKLRCLLQAERKEGKHKHFA